MLGRVVAMLIRLIDRFDTDGTRNRGSYLVLVLRFPNRPRPRSRPRPPFARERYHPVGSIDYGFFDDKRTRDDSKFRTLG